MVIGDAGAVPPAMPSRFRCCTRPACSRSLCCSCSSSPLGRSIAPYFSAQRLILPELVGDDERTVGQANAVSEGTQRATALLGPSLAGVLIAVIGATNVLYLDVASYFVSLVILVTLVPRRPPVAESEDAHGLLAGIRFLFRDYLLRVLAITALFLNMFGQMMVASLPVLAFDEYDESSAIAGLFFAAFGAGSLLGAVLAVKLLPRFDPIRLGAVSLVLLTVPIPLLGLPLPAWAVIAVLFTGAIFGPLVNAPLIGVLTTRTPESLRPKVMTGVITMAMLAGPVGLLVVGPLLASWGPRRSCCSSRWGSSSLRCRSRSSRCGAASRQFPSRSRPRRARFFRPVEREPSRNHKRRNQWESSHSSSSGSWPE